MANKQDLDFTYTTLDKIFRLSIGETGDFSGARYNGDFSLTLEEAQRAKHDYIADQLRIKKGSRVLDLGCGWGPFINYATNTRGAKCIGLTLSDGQAQACKSKGFEVHIKDCRKVKPSDFNTFDAVVSLGAFEHFCSVEEYKAGKQEEVYQSFFKSVADLLPKGGRFYLQTMVFGKNMIPYEKFDINADKNSDAYILALMEKQFPGSWLPYGHQMILKNADKHFNLIDMSSGRLDYIETIKQWRKKFREFNLEKYINYLSLVPSYLRDKEFRHKVAVFKISPNMVCFERELMDHYRIVFEKK
ncbi:class I SAM-dependent methyltransferase [Sporocytophaga myxococcoides]|uniref:class I SAM-dependent methyltransferase n=1 Tax=Sporocytophaga myxococcoides TaxID=153721 RepID=UPI0004085C51|nr:class I SAM-dependent methyltransferase [Sporocytophaga myxococcoides]